MWELHTAGHLGKEVEPTVARDSKAQGRAGTENADLR